MSDFFFSGATYTKLDAKNRFVLPQQLRYGLIEDGKLEFAIALGMGGSLAIYRKSAIDQIVKRFRAKQYVAKYQKFFTLFFSTLHHLTCDKLGRVVLPAVLKRAADIQGELVICGVLNKIEIWSKEKYERDLSAFLEGEKGALANVSDEAFALVNSEEEKEEAVLTASECAEYQEI
ncbi:MAG: hypothetical protein AAF443_04955 [Chlamydiota bacterium]